MRFSLFVWLAFVAGCESNDKATGNVGIDEDGDGVLAEDDCNDENAGVGAPTTYYVDADGDNFGDSGTGDAACEQPAGHVVAPGDCDDTNAAVYPTAEEICDGLDNDCNDLVDDEVEFQTYYTDADGDGYGDDATGTQACEPTSEMVETAGDCDDSDAAYNPGADESDCLDPNDYNCDGSVGYADGDGDGYAACEDCDDATAATNPDAAEVCDGVDNDCNGSIDDNPADAGTWYADADGDGFGDAGSIVSACEAGVGYVVDNTDCDDANASVNPTAMEVCNGVDDDCDALIDDADSSLDSSTTSSWYLDGDADGYADGTATVLGCEQPAGTTTLLGDCNDADAAYNPAASETDCLDPNDYNCDGSVGYDDTDGDGYAACEECDDAEAANYPGAPEVCDGWDNDCDAEVDEADAVDGAIWYADADADGFGDVANTTSACAAPSGFVADATDCDDEEFEVNPAASEVCNGIDDDCDALVDDADSSLDSSTRTEWFTDGDGDGYGDETAPVSGCDMPAGTAVLTGDCDDTDAAYNPGAVEFDCTDPNDYNCDGSVGYSDADGDGFAACEECNDADVGINPAAAEVCDGVDNDCNEAIDDGAADASIWYADVDGDTFGDAASGTLACEPEVGWVEDGSDCDDGRADVSPDALEVCNGFDDDCDALVDDADDSLDASTASSWYIDADVDGYGDDASVFASCADPGGAASIGGDCDDTDPAYNPGAIEADCADPNDYNCDGSVGAVDADGDGFVACDECDDGDASVFPGALEVCDGIDNNCDGTADESGAIDAGTWFADADGDGFGDAGSVVSACSAPAGYVADNTDCDDGNSAVSPAQVEVCDGVDNDCDGAVDDADDSLDASTASFWYTDADADGYGDDASVFSACADPGDAAALGGDCDDTDPAYNPGAVEADCTDPNDYNCDGSVGAGDSDGDGFAACDECDDGDASVFPGALEACDGIDNNCDGTVDEGDAIDAGSWYADVDADGFGDASSVVAACSAPSGYIADNTDCDDVNSTVNPAQIETCNGVDDDCDGAIDDGATDLSTWYADADGDGYGSTTVSTTACSQPSGYVANNRDCDDSRSRIHPLGRERCDGFDEDCDGVVDDGVTTTYYADADGDAYGDSSVTSAACSAPSGYVRNSTDCDDTAATVNPGAPELCNGVDDDCDGTVDDGASTTTHYADADGDGYGNASATTTGCTAPSGYVSDSTDCDDTASSINPGAAELCNGVDDDCDGAIDVGATDMLIWYADADDDGFGDADVPALSCTEPVGYVSDDTDCDDEDNAVNPDMLEFCNGIDDDCDGTVDVGAIDELTWYADADSDGFGDAVTTALACDAPAGYLADDADCDDSRADVNPGAAEVCNGYDDDCDALVDDDDGSLDASTGSVWYSDDDGDGYGDGTTTMACELPAGMSSVAGDCDDTDPAYNPGAVEVDCSDPNDYNCDGTVGYADGDGDGWAACDECDDADAYNYPGAPEYCDGTDNDCDGLVDEGDAVDASTWYADSDIDGFGDAGSPMDSCSVPAGYVADDTDCDDTNSSVNPAELEYCDGIDNDCDGAVDEADAVDASTWYADVDGDGYGDALTPATACATPAGYSADDTDCDDTDAAINPAAIEVCDTFDNNCDGSIDEGGVCPCDVEEYGGHSYMFCTDAGTWTEGRTVCLTYGYDLVAINSAAENTWVVAAAQARSGAAFWTGGNDSSVEGTWAWSNGDTWSYTNWRAGEPDDSGRLGEDCMQIGQGRAETWKDERCDKNGRYVCEQ